MDSASPFVVGRLVQFACRIIRKILKMIFSSHLDARYDSEEKSRQVRLLCLWGRHLINGMPPSLRGRKVAGQSSVTIAVVQSGKKSAN